MVPVSQVRATLAIFSPPSAAEEAVEAAAEEAVLVEEAEEPPQAVMAAVAPTTADAFRKSRREIIFIIVFSFISYLSIYTGAILHAPVIPVRIIPLHHPPVQENKFTRLTDLFCAISTNGFSRRRFLFTKHHNFSCFCNRWINAKRMCCFSFKKITKCCMNPFYVDSDFLYILKNFFRNSSFPSFCAFSSISRKFLQHASRFRLVPPPALGQKNARKLRGASGHSGMVFTDAAALLQC